MTPLRQRMIDDMRLRNFSPHTIEAYVGAVARLAKHFGQSPDQVSPEQVRQYLLQLVRERQASWSLYNQARCALQFLFRLTPVGLVEFGATVDLRNLRRAPPHRVGRGNAEPLGVLDDLRLKCPACFHNYQYARSARVQATSSPGKNLERIAQCDEIEFVPKNTKCQPEESNSAGVRRR